MKYFYVTFLFWAFVNSSIVSAQVADDGMNITISVTEDTGKPAASAVPHGKYLNGFNRAIRGQTIDYHSSYPDAEKALLVRTRQDVRSIAWETDPVKDPDGDYYNIIWLAGIEKSGWEQSTIPHRFDLSVNGEAWFTFRNLKDSSAEQWTIPGRDGSVLSFVSTMTDRFGDLFGYMVMRLPKNKFKSNMPLILEVTGEDAGSPDWYMTFQYSFNFRPKVRLEPALLRMQTNCAQMLRLSVDNLASGKRIEIISPNQKPINGVLNVGGNIFFIPVDEVRNDRKIPIYFSENGTIQEQSAVTVKPIAQKDIYLLSYSHNDIGYTDLQPNIERKQIKNLDDALMLIKQTSNYPPEARYKWNMEVIWSLESYLKRANEKQQREVIDAVRSGQLGLNALYANVLTGLANGVEMNHFTDYARWFGKEYSFPVRTACVSDIPGFTWGIVSVLAQSGVKYFSIAPNNGDRVGFIYDLGDKPFYWESQSGEEKILTWIAAASYSSFHEGDLARLGEEKIFKMMRKLDENNYPYDIIQVPYTIGGDNGPPDPNLSDFVKGWNEKYISPRLILGTHEQMFREFEKRYGSTLPTMKGDLTPYWEDGAFSSTKETFLNRHAADKLIQGEAVWSMRSSENFPKQEYYDAWRQVNLYDEHTWGAHNSITDPDSSFVRGQWEIKKQFAVDADSMSKALLVKAFAGTNENGGMVAVYNTNSWQRTDLVLLLKEQSLAGDLLVDEKGNKIASQRLTTGELAFIAANIPPLSAKRYFLKKGRARSKGTVRLFGTTIENGSITVTVDETSGAIKELTWKKIGQQLINDNGSAGLNRYFYIPGKNPDSALYLHNVRVKIKERGALVGSLIIEGEAPGCKYYSTEIRIIDGIGRVDIINSIHKIAVREKEGIHFGFPFAVPGGQLRYDVAWGIVRPESDQLPGACKNYFSVQSFVDISNSEYGVTWATPEAPLIEIGAINAEKPWMRTIAPSQTIYSYVMNNYWHTNYKADQEGLVVFRYSIQPHGKYKSDEAVRFGREQREPLIAIAAGTGDPIVPSLFTLEPPDVLATFCRPVAGGWHVQFYNASDRSQKVKIRWRSQSPVLLYASDNNENELGEINDGMTIPAHGNRFVRAIKK